MSKNKDIYIDAVEKFKTHPILYHYTSLEALRSILENQSFRLTCLANVNDKEENGRINSLWKSKVFVACFTHTLSNEDDFFDNYGNVRITLNNDFSEIDVFYDQKLQEKVLFYHKDITLRYDMNEEEYKLKENWCIFSVTGADIKYVKNLQSYMDADGYGMNPGLLKSQKGIDRDDKYRDWSAEQESRLRIAVRPTGIEAVFKKEAVFYPPPPFEHLYISVRNKIAKVELCKKSSVEDFEKFNRIMDIYSYSVD